MHVSTWARRVGGFGMRRTAVLVGVTPECTAEQAVYLRVQLERKYPGVGFVIIAGGSSVAFEYEAPDDEPAPPVTFDPEP